MKSQRSVYWITAVVCLIATAALPVWAISTRANYRSAVATIVDHKTKITPSATRAGDDVQAHLLVKFVHEGRAYEIEHDPAVYPVAFRTVGDALRQVAIDFPKNSQIEIFFDPVSLQTASAKGLTETEKVAILVGIVVAGLFSFLALRTDG